MCTSPSKNHSSKPQVDNPIPLSEQDRIHTPLLIDTFSPPGYAPGYARQARWSSRSAPARRQLRRSENPNGDPPEAITDRDRRHAAVFGEYERKSQHAQRGRRKRELLTARGHIQPERGIGRARDHRVHLDDLRRPDDACTHGDLRRPALRRSRDPQSRNASAPPTSRPSVVGTSRLGSPFGSAKPLSTSRRSRR